MGFRIKKPIALVGLAGSGKTEVGHRLAERLEVPFIDSDQEIERSRGRSICRIFSGEGEAAFRRMESAFLLQSNLSEPMVIATGGGAFLDQAARDHLLRHCVTIWLDSPVNVLAARIGKSKDRPLLFGKDARAALQEQAADRCPFYALADLRIDGDGSIDEVVERVLERLQAAPE